jgi:hypothetical protein
MSWPLKVREGPMVRRIRKAMVTLNHVYAVCFPSQSGQGHGHYNLTRLLYRTGNERASRHLRGPEPPWQRFYNDVCRYSIYTDLLLIHTRKLRPRRSPAVRQGAVGPVPSSHAPPLSSVRTCTRVPLTGEHPSYTGVSRSINKLFNTT